MTPQRLRECLETIRWAPSTLANSLQIDNALIDQWLDGSVEIPTRAASWIEALCFTHESSDMMRPDLFSDSDSDTASSPRRPEHIPVYSYGLLRQLNEGPVPLSALYGTADEAAVFFLVSRGLAERDGARLFITQAGRSLGEIEATS